MTNEKKVFRQQFIKPTTTNLPGKESTEGRNYRRFRDNLGRMLVSACKPKQSSASTDQLKALLSTP